MMTKEFIGNVVKVFPISSWYQRTLFLFMHVTHNTFGV